MTRHAPRSRTLAGLTAVAVACTLVAGQDARASDAHVRAGAAAGNTTIQSCSTAKKLMRQVFAGHERTFYCDCASDGSTVDVQTCGYQPQKYSKRARQLEWEHVVPAEAFGQSFVEWREGHPACVDRKGKAFWGRHCAATMAIAFRSMEADLYHLQPALGEVNQRRSNDSMAMIEGEPRKFGRCDLAIEDRKSEPRPEIRGDIARTSFYMDASDPGRGVISEKNRKLFEAWDKEDPVDAWERERVRRIERLQGHTNPLVK
jgi:deoxyribonuclease-1